MENFCFFTYCTSDYLLYAMNAMESAIKHHPLAEGHIICVGPPPLSPEMSRNHIQISDLANFPRANHLFEEAQKNRTYLESLISIKPTLLLEFQVKAVRADVIVYIDTDLVFFNSLAEFDVEHQDGDFVAIQHMYPTEPTHFPYGKFNGGFILTRKTEEAVEILRKWESLCVSWCQLTANNGKYADQGYLERLLTMPRGKGVKSDAVNVGMHYLRHGPEITVKHGTPHVKGSPLVAFHFHGLKVQDNLIWTGLNRYGFGIRNLKIYKVIYQPVVERILQIMEEFADFQTLRISGQSKSVTGREFVRRMKRTVIRIPKS